MQAKRQAAVIWFACGVALSDHPTRACESAARAPLIWIAAANLPFDDLDLYCMHGWEDERSVVLQGMRGALAEGWIPALQMELAVVLGQLRQTVQDVEDVLPPHCNSAETVAPDRGDCTLLAAISRPAGSGVAFAPMPL